VIIGGAVLGVATWRNGREGSAVRYPSGVTTVLAAYPASVARTMDAQKFMESDAHWDWWDSYRELTAKSAELQSGMDAYYQNLMKQMLVSEDENTVCSPINLYIRVCDAGGNFGWKYAAADSGYAWCAGHGHLTGKCFFTLGKQLCRHTRAEKCVGKFAVAGW